MTLNAVAFQADQAFNNVEKDLHFRDTGSSTSNSHSNANTPSSISQEEEKKDDWIWVLDPMTRKLRVPLRLLSPTQATATTGTVPSLCIAYLEGRCRHPWCRQAHVLPSAIPQLRYEALNAPTCCHVHNDPHDISRLTSRFRYIRIVNNGASGDSELIPTDRVACTVGLLRYLVHNVPPTSKKEEETSDKEQHTPRDGEDVLELPAKFICRLHLAHRCRYLEDCNNIHVCREYELRLQPPPNMVGPLSSVSTSTRTIHIGDVCYTVTPLAVGDLGDNDFNAIAEAQKINHQNSTTTPSYEEAISGGAHAGASYVPPSANSSYLRIYDVRTAAERAARSGSTSSTRELTGGNTAATTSETSLPPPPRYTPKSLEGPCEGETVQVVSYMDNVPSGTATAHTMPTFSTRIR